MKGFFGESLCGHFFTKSQNLRIHTKNQRTPFGEIDLIVKDDTDYLYPIEVKMILTDRLENEVWSYQQRKRFLKSIAYLNRNNFSIKDYGLFLIYPKGLSYICSSDLFS